MSAIMKPDPVTDTSLGAAIEQVLVTGDLAKLNPQQRVDYYNATCKSLGINPLTRPFDYVTLNGKLLLYARKDCTEQLRRIHGVSLRIVSREVLGDVYVVTVGARDREGREDESTGAVAIANMKGENLANAYMKAETKAKRRATLSLCGLGLLDETEVASIETARPYPEASRLAAVTPITDVATVVTEEPEPPADPTPDVEPWPSSEIRFASTVEQLEGIRARMKSTGVTDGPAVTLWKQRRRELGA